MDASLSSTFVLDPFLIFILSPSVGPVTPIDLELDLAAQQSKLKMLQDEIDRLKAIKVKLEEAKVKGDKDVPNWFLEEERFQQTRNVAC